MQILKIPKDEWSVCSAKAHLVSFGQGRPPEFERIDYALLAVRGETPLGYITCREHDGNTVYWQFGGSFPGTRGTVLTWKLYQAGIALARESYQRITTYISNENIPMLKLAMKAGFRVIGVRNFKRNILLELMLDFEGGN